MTGFRAVAMKPHRDAAASLAQAPVPAGQGAAAIRNLHGEEALRSAVLDSAVFTTAATWRPASWIDRPRFWRALQDLVDLCGEWPLAAREAVISAHRADGGFALVVRVCAHEAAWRSGAGVDTDAETGSRHGDACPFLEHTPRFLAARRVIESLGGSLGSFGETRSTGIAAAAWFPFSREPERAPLPTPSLAGRQVLVVDDWPDVAATLCDFLHVLGAQAVPVSDGERAIWFLSRLKPDAMLVDLVMPPPDGYDIARWVRMRPACDGVRLVALSSFSGRDSLCRSAACGFDDYLLKPSDTRWLAHAASAGAGSAIVHRATRDG